MHLHSIPPVYDKNSKILILGSFPSVKSREYGFFYAHPQNRFWKVLAFLFKDEITDTVEEKKSFLLRHNIAVWDVIASCDIEGSSDNSISNVTVNNISSILNHSSIDRIFVNGRKAEELYKKYIEPKTKIKALYLPSTSPANAAMTIDTLISKWSVIL